MPWPIPSARIDDQIGPTSQVIDRIDHDLGQVTDKCCPVKTV